MLIELEKRETYLTNKELNSVYFGGGTPSLLSSSELNKLLSKLASKYILNTSAEITLEVNPDDVTKENLKNWLQLGINRLSIGVQTFDDNELLWMNRSHNSEQAVTSVKLAQDVGFNNLSIDLIYGSKFQTLNTWEETLKMACNLDTKHISSYNLTIEDNTILGVLNKKGKEPSVNDELSSNQFKIMSEYITQQGFEHYEISNFGKPNYLAVHNSNYWLQKHYLGIGPSAHSFNGETRQWNVKNNNAYIKALNENTTFFEIETLTEANKYNEYILTSLRTKWGCNEKFMKRFSNKIQDHFLQKTNSFLQSGEVIKIDEVYTLSIKGRLIADKIAAELFFIKD